MRTIRRSLRLAALSVPGLLALAAGTAEAGPVADLCGTTVAQSITIRNVDDTLTVDCAITVADGVELSLVDVVLDAAGFRLDVTGLGRGSLGIRRSQFSHLFDSRLLFEDGRVTLGPGIVLQEELNELSVRTRDGDIVVKGSRGSVADDRVLQVEATGGGRVEMIGNEFRFPGSTGRLRVRTRSGRTRVAQNVFGIDGDGEVTLESASGAILVSHNTFELQAHSALQITSASGRVVVFENAGAGGVLDVLATTGAGNVDIVKNQLDVESLTVQSTTGDVAVKHNDFGAPDGHRDDRGHVPHAGQHAGAGLQLNRDPDIVATLFVGRGAASLSP